MKRILSVLTFAFCCFSGYGQAWFSGTIGGDSVVIDLSDSRVLYNSAGKTVVTKAVNIQYLVDQSMATVTAAGCNLFITVNSAKLQGNLKPNQQVAVNRLFIEKVFPQPSNRALLVLKDSKFTIQTSQSYNTIQAALKACMYGTGSPSGSAGGDLGGTYPNPVVTGIQGDSVSSDAPDVGDVLIWNGDVYAPTPAYRDSVWTTQYGSFPLKNNLDSMLYRRGGIHIKNRDNIPGTGFARDTVFLATADLNEGIGIYLSDISSGRDGQYIYFGTQNAAADSTTTLIEHDSLGRFVIYQNALQEGTRSLRFDSTGTRITAGRDDKIKLYVHSTYDALTLSDSTSKARQDFPNDTLYFVHASVPNEERWLTATQLVESLDLENLGTGIPILENEEETAAAAQTSFTLSSNLYGSSDLTMYRNGVLLTSACYSVVGTTVTYVPASNGGQAMEDGDRINFIYQK